MEDWKKDDALMVGMGGVVVGMGGGWSGVGGGWRAAILDCVHSTGTIGLSAQSDTHTHTHTHKSKCIYVRANVNKFPPPSFAHTNTCTTH